MGAVERRENLDLLVFPTPVEAPIALEPRAKASLVQFSQPLAAPSSPPSLHIWIEPSHSY